MENYKLLFLVCVCVCGRTYYNKTIDFAAQTHHPNTTLQQQQKTQQIFIELNQFKVYAEHATLFMLQH